jgi:hypothetical protein
MISEADGKGWIINVNKGKNKFVIRIMNAGSGQRTKPYYRVSIPAKSAFTVTGKLSSDQVLTHIDLTNDYLKQIDTIINTYLLNKGSKL